MIWPFTSVFWYTPYSCTMLLVPPTRVACSANSTLTCRSMVEENEVTCESLNSTFSVSTWNAQSATLAGSGDGAT